MEAAPPARAPLRMPPMSPPQLEALRGQTQKFQELLKRQAEMAMALPIPPPESRLRAEDLPVSELKLERKRMVGGYHKAAYQLLQQVPEPDIQTQIRLHQLELLPLQAKVRKQMCDTFEHYHGANAVSEWTSGRRRFQREVQSNARRVRMARDGEEKSSRKIAKAFFDHMFRHGHEIKEAAKKSKVAHRKDMLKVQKWHNDKVREDRKLDEKRRRDRIEALKNDDEEAYLKLLIESKDERLQHLMKETEAHLELLTAKITDVKAQGVETGVVADGGMAAAGSTSSTAADPRAPTPRTAGQRFQASAHALTEKITEQPAMLQGGDLKEYQMSGLNWLISLYNNNLNGILADEMGLGKTIQTIALLAHLIQVKGNPGPYLVVVPLSVLPNWKLELEKWTPSIRVVTFKGPASARKRIFREEMSDTTFNVVLTTYEYILKGKAHLRKFTWQYIIIDEGHRIKNSESKLASMLGDQYTSRYRLLLTGTPLQNKLSELWSLLNFLLPSVFNSSASFEAWFNEPMAKLAVSGPVSEEQAGLNEEETLLIVNRLHSIVKPFMLRRMKSDVESQLPQKVEHVLKCDLSAWQKQLYRQLKGSGLQTQGLDGSVSTKQMMNVMMQLRKVCNHPFLFDQEDMPIATLAPDIIYRAAGKFELLDRMLPKLLKTGHKVLIFSQMTKILDLLEDYLIWRKTDFGGYLRLDGHTKADDRGSIVDQFMDPAQNNHIFLLTTRAGGVGLNLQVADTVIIFDSDWNPQMDLQAQDRAHRIGQQNEVRVYRLLTNTPIEEEIFGRAQEKQKVNKIIVRETGEDDSLRQQRLRKLLAGDEKVADDSDEEESAVHSWAELNLMLARNEDEVELFQKMDTELLARCAAEWGGEGKLSKYQGRLMTDAECPKWMTHVKDDAATLSTEPVELGKRKTKEINYKGQSDLEFNRLLKNGGEEPGEAGSSGAKKRKSGQKVPKQLKAHMMKVWTRVNKSKAEDGRLRNALFEDLPDKKLYPDYYQMIKRPISLRCMKNRMEKHYHSIDLFQSDMMTMFNNARTYNEVGSWVYEDANAMQTEYEAAIAALPSGVISS